MRIILCSENGHFIFNEKLIFFFIISAARFMMYKKFNSLQKISIFLPNTKT